MKNCFNCRLFDGFYTYYKGEIVIQCKLDKELSVYPDEDYKKPICDKWGMDDG